MTDRPETEITTAAIYLSERQVDALLAIDCQEPRRVISAEYIARRAVASTMAA